MGSENDNICFSVVLKYAYLGGNGVQKPKMYLCNIRMFPTESIGQNMPNLECVDIATYLDTDIFEENQPTHEEMEHYIPFFKGLAKCPRLVELGVNFDFADYVAYFPNTTFLKFGQHMTRLNTPKLWIFSFTHLEKLRIVEEWSEHSDSEMEILSREHLYMTSDVFCALLS